MYAWLAAWLSCSAENIFLPVNGLFNPMQKNGVDLLPFDDLRYKFFLFPINYAVPVERHADLHTPHRAVLARYGARGTAPAIRRCPAVRARSEPNPRGVRSRILS